MIRFLDKNACTVLQDGWSREDLMDFFLQGHRGEAVCVLNQNGTFQGTITYASLSEAESAEQSIQTECVVFDKNIWKNSRNYFNNAGNVPEETVLLPVLNQDHRLLCFAYQDPEADRELRMLWELTGRDDLLGFEQIYPEYECVIIEDLNELSYYLAVYLNRRGIPVQLKGDFWNELELKSDDTGHLDYKCFTVYAEGTAPFKNDLPDLAQGSTGAEFECVDRIYEENIRCGFISDAGMDASAFLEKLRAQRELVILGTDVNAQNVYDFLLKEGIFACCFLSDAAEEKRRRLFGIEVLSEKEIRKRYKAPVYLECSAKYSAWGFGGTDRYAAMGYARNERFFLFRDYLPVPDGSLLRVLNAYQQIILAGDIRLCSRLFQYLRGILPENMEIGYLDVLKELDGSGLNIPVYNPDAVGKETVCFLAAPDWFPDSGKAALRKRKLYAEGLREAGIDDYSDYFSDIASYVNIMEGEAYLHPQLKPAGIVIGVNPPNSRSTILKNMLDVHPDIVMLPEKHFVTDHLFLISTCLAEEQAEHIPERFWRLYRSEGRENGAQEEFPEREAFDRKLLELTSLGGRFTSQEIFVMLHIAFAAMRGREITDIQDKYIYWEPRFCLNVRYSVYAKWLRHETVRGFTLSFVRNAYIRAGSFLEELESAGRAGYSATDAFTEVFRQLDQGNQEVQGWHRLELKFEDVMRRPKEELKALCRTLSIRWTDKLLQDLCNDGDTIDSEDSGRLISSDLKPVYNRYEEYFSALDRLRIILVNAPWQKKYGYDWISPGEFTRKELQELIRKEFRFEKLFQFDSDRDQRKCRAMIQRVWNQSLQEVRRLEMLQAKDREL